MKKNKRLVQIYFSIILFSNIFLITGFYAYDPLQLFHKPWGREVTFNKNMRQQAAGIINNYKFDSIILGSSMFENTSSLESNIKLSGDFINISAAGSTYYERSLIMTYIFKKQPIKKVIYSLDEDSYLHQRRAYPGYPLELFDYLYDENRLNDFKAYLNYDFIKCLLTISKNEECIGQKTTLDRPSAWYNNENYKSRFGGLNKWFQAKNDNKIKMAFKKIVLKTKYIESGKVQIPTNIDNNISRSKYYIDETIINFVKKYPETEFIMVFPPYSRMYYALWAQYDLPYFKMHKAIIEYLVQKSEVLPNLKIFAFGDHAFLNNIANYKDTAHYHYSINSWILSEIKKGNGQLTKTNLNKYLNYITKEAQSYDLISIGHQIDNYLNRD